MSDSKEILYQWIKESNNIVFFGGAGVSTESNIPDFRSVDGLYHQTYDYPLKPFSPIVFISVIRKNFINFIGIK